jgi:hypothetical protein
MPIATGLPDTFLARHHCGSTAIMRTLTFQTVAAIAVATSIMLSGNAAAQSGGNSGVFIQGGHSGTWYHPVQPGHGLFIEVLDDATSPTGKEVVAAWFAYFGGTQIWLLGQGDVALLDESFTAELEVSIFEGNDFPPRYDPDLTVGSTWGKITLEFHGCDQALMTWESELPEYGDGELSLSRLTRISDSDCIPDLGGGVPSDDHGDTWETATFLTDIGSATRARSGALEKNGDVDVFVITLTEAGTLTAYTLGPGELDTVGELLALINYREVLVATEDEGSHFGGFMITETVPAGTYSLHVRGKDDRETGPYKLYYKFEDD